jgi:hypothetical protein
MIRTTGHVLRIALDGQSIRASKEKPSWWVSSFNPFIFFSIDSRAVPDVLHHCATNMCELSQFPVKTQSSHSECLLGCDRRSS